MFCQGHCHKIFAFTYLQFDRTTPSPRPYSLYSSIYTPLYMKSMLFYRGTHSAMLSRLHIPLNASWETASIEWRCVEMHQKLIFFYIIEHQPQCSWDVHTSMKVRMDSLKMHLQSQVSAVLRNRNFIKRLRILFATCFLLIMTQSLINFLFKD